MAQKVGDRVQQAGQAATSAIQGGKDAFAAAAQKAGLGFDPSKATTSAQARTLSQTTYAGPHSWKDANSGVNVTDVNRAVNAGQAAVAQLQSQGGLANLLRESYNTNSTAGGSALDAALTGAAGGGRFQQLQQQFGGLDKLLSGAMDGAEGVAKGAEDATTKAARQYDALARNIDERNRMALEDHASLSAERQTPFVQRNNAQERADSPGQWGQNESDALDDIKSTPRTNRRRVGGN